MNVEQIKNKLKVALLADPKSADRNLTLVFGGTSVTAGHDNLYNQSYPFAFERAASCAFKAAGINLIVSRWRLFPALPELCASKALASFARNTLESHVTMNGRNDN